MSDPAKIKEWNQVRTAFASSILVDTALPSLAENLDGPAWPGKDRDETPAAYIDLEYAMVVEELAARGYPANTMDRLVTILRETLAFDDPFGEMVEHSETVAAADNPLLDNLARLEIPADFPVGLTQLSRETKEFCALEKLATLGEFAVFAQSMSQNVVVGGDFRGLLNALSHIDEKAIARYLPFRVGAKGLHLVEALASLVRGLRDLERATLAKPGTAPSDTTAARVTEFVRHFSTQFEALKARVVGGSPLSRELVVLQDPPVEEIVARLLAPHLPGTVPEKKSGWLGRLFGR